MRRVAPLALVLSVACSAPQRVPIRLPPREAPIEARAAAYRANAATVHQSFWQGWQVELGDAPGTVSLRDARPLLENAPPASAILADRDRQLSLGWGLLGGGIAATLGGALLIPLAADGAFGRSRDDAALLIPAGVSLAGVAVMVIGAFIGGAAETQTTRAASAYNRWLWDALGLPRAGAAPVAPSSDAPWGAPAPR